MTKTTVDTLILGAGLSGLSTAYHLHKQGKTNFLVLEKQSVPGGLCASTCQNGFTYDFGGHVLHLHTDYGKKLVQSLLKNNLNQLERRAFIYTQNAQVPFPYQAHLYALPPTVRNACAKGLLKAPHIAHPQTLKTWCLTHFGTGIYTHFFKPYNTKLWGVTPEKLTCEWCASFVPRPTADQVAQSLQCPPAQTYGYNAAFYYPKQGGIGSLVHALAAPIKNRVRLNAPVTQIDLSAKTAVCNAERIHFQKLVNTLPLPAFVQLLAGQTRLKKYAAKLQAAPITLYHLGINRPLQSFSWIYFPDEQDLFYRVGLQSGFSSNNAPKGASLLYIELPGLHTPSKALAKHIWNGLVQKGIIEKTDVPAFEAWQHVPQAYVLYTFEREQVLPLLLHQLRTKGVYSAGRYGRWEYSFMESALLQGNELATQLGGTNT